MASMTETSGHIGWKLRAALIATMGALIVVNLLLVPNPSWANYSVAILAAAGAMGHLLQSMYSRAKHQKTGSPDRELTK